MPEDATRWPDEVRAVIPYERTLDSVIGTEFDLRSPDEGPVGSKLTITDALRDHTGALHGGVVAAAAEALASRATALVTLPEGNSAQGLSNDTTVARAVQAGEVTFTATVVSRADDAWVWLVEAHDTNGDAFAVSRVTVAVRPLSV